MNQQYRIYLAVIGFFSFVALLLLAAWLAYVGQSASAAWAGGGGIVAGTTGLFSLLKSLGQQ